MPDKVDGYILRESPLDGGAQQKEISGTDFDEVYVGNWLGAERMDENVWCVWLADALIHVDIGPNGRAALNIIRGNQYDEVSEAEQRSWPDPEGEED